MSESLAHADYKALWNARAGTVEAAMAAVDGSRDEATLRLTGAYSAAQVRAALDLQPDDRVFELGCGVGRIGRELIGTVAHWQGLDIAENMLAAAAQRLDGHGAAGFAALHGPRLPLADASVDKGYCVAVFIHMDKEDFLLYLRDVARALRPGGLFYFDHWNLAHPVGWRRFELELAQALRVPAGERKEAARNQFCTPDEVRLYLQHADLQIVCERSDSPWVQVVARRPLADAVLDADDHAHQAARCAAQATRIDYGADWTVYFDAILDPEFDGQPPQRLYRLLMAAASKDSVAHMYRAYLHGLWTARAAAWGPPPADLFPEP